MSEAPTEGGNNGGETPPAIEFEPITSQDDLNRIVGDRVKRATAKFADYKDLQAKAARLDEIENANRTEAEKAQARIADLEQQLTETQVASTRLRVAAEHGITDAEDIALFLTGADEETLTKQAQRLAQRTADRMKNGNTVPREGATPSKNQSEAHTFVSEFFGSGG